MCQIDALRKELRCNHLPRIPGVGPTVARGLLELGVRSVATLRRRDPERLYEQLCAIRGQGRDRAFICLSFRNLFRLSPTARLKTAKMVELEGRKARKTIRWITLEIVGMITGRPHIMAHSILIAGMFVSASGSHRVF